jgi:glycosyltransferase involved in cell wall biosynthesis
MKKIALTFPLLTYFGGAELCAVKIANHLSKKNKIDLIFCGSDINKNLKKILSRNINLIALKPKNVILNYFVRNIILFAQCYIILFLKDKNYEKIISASGEIVNKKKVYQFIHHPFFSLNIINYLSLGIRFYEFHKLLIRFILTFTCRIIFRINKVNLSKNITFTNSKWSADKYKTTYNITNNVFYNYPTFTLKKNTNISFNKFEERENNFIILGRVTPDKKIHDVIKLFNKICEKFKSLNLKLTIIGPTPDTIYLNKCKNLSKNNNIFFTGFISENEKENILNNSKYGLHLFYNEHFGMAPCEMQNHNILVFVNKGGGIIEFIDNKNQQFTNYDELIDKISILLIFKQKRFKNFKLMLKNKNKIIKHNFYSRLDLILKE